MVLRDWLYLTTYNLFFKWSKKDFSYYGIIFKKHGIIASKVKGLVW